METLYTPSVEEIQLQRILDFPLFKNSPTLSRFLEFTVTETVNKREYSIKEYSIAINVLNRPPNFNSHEDAVVRIHAGRLRKALKEYYLTDGANDTVVISIPKGSYVPQFKVLDNSTLRPHQTASAPLSSEIPNPVVAVFPFRAVPETEETRQLSTILGEEISSELSLFQDFSVIGYYSMETNAKISQNILEAAKNVGADYVITGTIQYHEKRIRIRVNLLITATGEVKITKVQERDYNVSPFETQNEIVQMVIGAVGGYYGLIFQEMAKASLGKFSGHITTWEAIYNYYQYQRSFSIENYTLAVDTLKAALKTNPEHAVSWAMLGGLYLDGLGMRLQTIDNPIEESHRCTMQALKIDPLCQHAWHTLTWIHLFKSERESCLNSARYCIELNPNSFVLVAGISFMLICAGYFEEGFRTMQKSIQLNQHYPWWINGGLSLYYIQKSEYETALYWAEKMNCDEIFWGPLLKSVSLSYMGKMAESKIYLNQLLEIEPAYSEQIRTMISTFILSEELISKMIFGLENVEYQVE